MGREKEHDMEIENQEEVWEKLTLSNDFLFGAVMSNPELCKKMLETLLDIKIKKIEYPEQQKVIDLALDAKGVRLDIYVEDEVKTVYNVEIQTRMKKKVILPKRSRYYQGMIDLNHINKGEDYDTLKKSFVIFICTFDPFGKGLHRYTFETRCKEDSQLVLQDEAYKIFFNTKGNKEDITKEAKAFLEYLDGKESDDEFVERLAEEVKKVKRNEKWRRDYMMLYMRDKENREEGRQEGRQEGQERIVLNMIQKGMDLEQIADLTDIPLEEVKKIDAKM